MLQSMRVIRQYMYWLKFLGNACIAWFNQPIHVLTEIIQAIHVLAEIRLEKLHALAEIDFNFLKVSLALHYDSNVLFFHVTCI